MDVILFKNEGGNPPFWPKSVCSVKKLEKLFSLPGRRVTQCVFVLAFFCVLWLNFLKNPAVRSMRHVAFFKHQDQIQV